MVRNEKAFLIVFRLWRNLSKKRKLQSFFLIFLMVLSSVSDLISLGSVIPFTSVLIEPDLLINNNYYPFLSGLLGIDSTDNLVPKIVFLFIITALLSALFKILYLWYNLRLSANIGNDLSAKAFLNTIYQPYSTHLNWSSSKLITTISTEVNMTVIALYTIFLMISSFLLSLFLSIFLLITHPLLSLICIVVFISSYFFLSIATKKRLFINSENLSSNIGKRHQIHQEALGAIRDVILDGSHKFYYSKFKKFDRSIRLIEADNNFITSSPRSIIECVGLVFIALLTYFFISDNNNPASFLPFLAALTLGLQKFLPAVQQIYGGSSQLRSFYAAIRGVIEFIELKIPTSPVDNLKINPFDFRQLELFNINYAYPNTRLNTLSDINLTISKGERIGIVGPSGSGKSTLMDILLGLIRPSSGDLKINKNKNLYSKDDDFNLYKWRKSIAHVPQFIFLIDSNIYENIAFGINKNDIDKNKVIEAAKQAQIDSFIRDLPNGYDTKIGERGVRLSGGQRQRLGIARAIYKDAKVLILDEATSSLDNITEKKVMDSINKLSRNLTIIMVAHRLSTLADCDKIVTLRKGGFSIKENNNN